MKDRQALHGVTDLANTRYDREVTDSGCCSSGIIRLGGFREVGSSAWGAPCTYPAPFSFSLHHKLLPTVGFDGVCGLEAGRRDKNSSLQLCYL